jgi:hypothetical protein
MTPLHTYLPNASKGALAGRTPTPAFFGSSSRNWGTGSRDRSGGDDDEDAASRRHTYRTLCVRLCDGYYFPISFSTTKDRLGRDAKTCERSCGTQARLFIYRNPGNDIEDMVDLRGQPYRKLSTAFLYRTEYVPSCRCQPNPWDAETKERHRVYALMAAKSKGNRQAAAELAELNAKAKQRAKGPAQIAAPPSPAAPHNPQRNFSALPRPDSTKMSLGRGLSEPRARVPRQAPQSDQQDWRRRAFGQS